MRTNASKKAEVAVSRSQALCPICSRRLRPGRRGRISETALEIKRDDMLSGVYFACIQSTYDLVLDETCRPLEVLLLMLPQVPRSSVDGRNVRAVDGRNVATAPVATAPNLLGWL